MVRAFGYVLLRETEYQQLLLMRIVRTPGVLGGEPRIAGTRISVRDIVEYMRIYDRDMDRVLQELPDLSEDDITAAMAYYAAHREEIDEAIRPDEEAEEEMLRDADVVVWCLTAMTQTSSAEELSGNCQETVRVVSAFCQANYRQSWYNSA